MCKSGKEKIEEHGLQAGEIQWVCAINSLFSKIKYKVDQSIEWLKHTTFTLVAPKARVIVTREIIHVWNLSTQVSCDLKEVFITLSKPHYYPGI